MVIDDVEQLPSLSEAVFVHVAWALQVVGDSFRRMHAECKLKGRPDLWGLFAGRVLVPLLNGGAPEPFERLAARLGFGTAKQAATAVVYLSPMS